jgi:hypothetical protein
MFTELGLMLETLYNLSIGFGQKIKLQSGLQPASGEALEFLQNLRLGIFFNWLFLMTIFAGAVRGNRFTAAASRRP